MALYTHIKFLVGILLLSGLLACGTATENQSISVSGHVDIGTLDTDSIGPVFVAILGSNPVDNLDTISDALLAIQSVNTRDGNFRLDLTDSGKRAGDSVYIVAIVDNDFSNGIPEPNVGDYIGYYLDPAMLSPAYVLSEGDNSGIEISVTKEVFDFEASLSGTVNGEGSGKLTVFAYAGDIDSLSFSAIDPDHIVGYTNATKKDDDPVAFTMTVLPYGITLPLADVYLIAYLDANSNGLVDGGDRLGFLVDGEGMPELTVLTEGDATGYVLELSLTLNSPSGYSMGIQGTIDVSADMEEAVGDRDVFLALIRNDGSTDLSALSQGDLSALAYYQRMKPSERSFYVDLSQSGLAPGDEVIVAAFCDLGFQSGFPVLDEGDVIGYHVDTDSLSPGITLSEGVTSGIDITLSKRVYDYDTAISGTVSGTATGDLTVIAYKGEIDSLDFDGLDSQNIIGYTTRAKYGPDADYTLSILPYGQEMPMDQVYLISFLDVNVNGSVDAGDRVGMYTGSQGLPEMITLTEDGLTGMDMTLSMTVQEPSGDSIQLQGSIEIPEDLESTLGDGRLFLLVVRAEDDPDVVALSQGDLSDLAYYYKLPAGSRDFNIDLSDSGLAAGDKVILIAACDVDDTEGFPAINTGDYLGYFMNYDLLGPEYVLAEGLNSGLVITVDKEVFDYQASLSGTLPAGLTGTATIFAYAGSFDSLDFSEFDLNEVVGYTTLALTGEAVGFTVDIMPYGRNIPIENVYLMVFLDVNANGLMDAGDMFGFYTGGSGLPALLTVAEGDQPGLDLEPDMEIAEPSGDDIWMSGHITVPDDLASVISNKELFVFVIQSEGLPDFDAIAGGDLSSVAYFKKMQPYSRDFSLNLSDTGLSAGDKVMVVALCDMEYAVGFPDIGAGDYLGYYINTERLGPELDLTEGDNDGVDITLSKEIFDYDASLSGQVSGSDTGNLFVFAYAGDIDSLDLTDLDMNEVIGYASLEKTSATVDFTVDILPFGYNVPIGNVFLLAFLDTNGNDIPDAGDKVGYVANDQGLPALLTVEAGSLGDLFIDLTMSIPEPSGYALSMNGTLDVVSDLSTNVSDLPIFILVVDAGEDLDLSGLAQGDMSDVAFFRKMPAGTRDFSFNLSGTGLAPGDRVLVLAVCDREYTAGFPSPSEGDYMGYYQDRDAMDVLVTLQEGANTVENSGNRDFTLSKIMYDHNASIEFKLDDANLNNLNPSVSLDPGEHVTVVAVQSDGVDIGSKDIDMDYIIGFGSITVPEQGNDGYVYSLDILPAVDRRITVDDPFAIDDVYVFAIFDGNLNGTSDQNDYLGYYWTTFLFTMYPKELGSVTDGINTLDKTVRFTTQKM